MGTEVCDLAKPKSLLETAWEQREETIYPALFGDIGQGIYTLPHNLFKDRFGYETVDPRWFHYGVFKSPPNNDRKTWLYVSSGMSNPWDVDYKGEYSGLGIELMLETLHDQPWAIPLVHSLIAYNLMLSVGKFGDKPLLNHGARLPQPIGANISHLALGSPANFPTTIETDAGKADLLQIVGLTQAEFDHAKDVGTAEVLNLLQQNNHSFAINPERESLL